MIPACPALRRLALASTTLVSAALATPATAQNTAPPVVDDSNSLESDEIIVSGTAEDQARARTYINALQPASFSMQAARWADPICIGVSGTSPPIAQRFAGRINATASIIGARLASGACKPNLVIMFTDDAAATTIRLKRKSVTRLAEIPRSQESFVFGKDAPIRWWYNTDMRGSDGRPLTAAATGMVQCAGPCAMPSMGQNVRSTATFSSSRIQNPTIRQITSAVVVIDTKLAAGRAIDSLGDYAALVALAEIWPRQAAKPGDSILTLFDAPAQSGDGMPLLSPLDQRFLCQLYRLPLARSGGYHAGVLMQAISAGGDTCFDRAR